MKTPPLPVRTALLCAALAALGLCPAPAAQAASASWPQPAFDAAQSWFNPAETALSPATVSGLRQLAARQAGNDYAGPAVQSGGVMFFCTDVGGLLAVNLANRHTVWTHPGPNGGHCNAAVLDDATAYEAVNAYDPSTGATATTLAALDRVTGQVRWQVAGPQDPPLPAARWLGFNAATLSQGALFVTNQRSVVSAYEAASGALRWRAYTDLLNNQATVAGPLVYTTTWGGAPNALFAHRVADGTLAWSRTLDASNTEYPAAVANGRVFVGTDLGALRAMNAGNGDALWTVSFSGYLSAPIVATADTVIVNIGLRSFTALDAASGVAHWTATLPGTVVASSNLVLANDVLYFVVADLLGTQHLAALDARTGTKLDLSGAAPVGGHYASISVVGGRVYVTDTSGGVQVYGLVKSLTTSAALRKASTAAGTPQ